MSYSTLYYYNRTFTDLGVPKYSQAYNITCSATGFETQNYTSSIDVKWNVTMLEFSQVLANAGLSGSVVLGNVITANPDIIVAGYQGQDYIDIYANNGSSFVNKTNLTGLTAGTLALIDLYRNGNLEIVDFGMNYSGSSSYYIYKKN